MLYATALILANGLFFVLVFGGCDYLTQHRELRVRIHLDSELAIPFVAPMTLIYMSVYVLFGIGPFILRTREAFRDVIVAHAWAIGIAGVCFLLLPGQLAYAPVSQSQLGAWAGLYRIADEMNLTYNLVPSLHVALSVVCVSAFAARANGAVRALLWFWAFAIALSTLLTHQHHLLDVVTGWLLGLGVRKKAT